MSDDGVCECLPGFAYYDPDLGECICPDGQVPNADGVCDCPPPLLLDTATGACKCPESYMYWDPDLDECVCPDGSPMLPDGTCQCPPNQVMTDDGECKCPPPFEYFDPDLGVCICPDFMVYGPGGLCQCPQGTVLNADGECVACPFGAVPNADGSCPCPGDLTWSAGECVCPPPFDPLPIDPDLGTCECPPPLLLDAIAGECACPEGTVLTADGLCKCSPSFMYWDPDLDQCMCPDGSEPLDDGTCKCPEGQAMSDDGVCECPEGTFLTANGECKCPGGQLFDPADGTCDCPGNQVLEPATGECGCVGGAFWDPDLIECRCPDGLVLAANNQCVPDVCVDFSNQFEVLLASEIRCREEGSRARAAQEASVGTLEARFWYEGKDDDCDGTPDDLAARNGASEACHPEVDGEEACAELLRAKEKANKTKCGRVQQEWSDACLSCQKCLEDGRDECVSRVEEAEKQAAAAAEDVQEAREGVAKLENGAANDEAVANMVGKLATAEARRNDIESKLATLRDALACYE